MIKIIKSELAGMCEKMSVKEISKEYTDREGVAVSENKIREICKELNLTPKTGRLRYEIIDDTKNEIND